MATYLGLNILFIVVILLLLKIQPRRPSKALLVTLCLLVVLTLIFDNVIVGLSIVGYDPSKILGVKLGVAPIEDFMYAVLAVVLVPALWHILGRHNAARH